MSRAEYDEDDASDLLDQAAEEPLAILWKPSLVERHPAGDPQQPANRQNGEASGAEGIGLMAGDGDPAGAVGHGRNRTTTQAGRLTVLGAKRGYRSMC